MTPIPMMMATRLCSRTLRPRFLAHAASFQNVRSFSVSQAEVSKFSELSSSWWDPQQNPLVGMNPIRVQYMMQQLPGKSFEGLHVMDVGCGGGLLSESLARLGAKTVTSVDPSTQLVETAQRRSERQGLDIDYRGGISVEDLVQSSPSLRASMDVICILEVLEHVTDVDAMLNSAAGLLKPDGTLFVSTLNQTAKSYLAGILGAEYIMGYLKPGTHDWNKFIAPAELQRKVEAFGLEEVDVQGMILDGLPPPLGQWSWALSQNDVDVNWIGTYRKV